MVDGLHETDTELIVGACAFTVTAVVPNFVASWTEVAVTLAVPAPDGVNTPAAVIVPPIADHVTAAL
jgi:hypothetical protein